jgi:hypothetical protein
MAKAHHCKELIARAFTYHSPTLDQVEKYKRIRDEAKILALTISAECPQSAESARAINFVRQAVMWANAAIACNEATLT